MLINEAIERADALLANEYSREEKYHWCDVVGAELSASYIKKFRRERLERYGDGLFLLPQDCSFDRIEKVIAGFNRAEIPKRDMRTFGIRQVFGCDGEKLLQCAGKGNEVGIVYRMPYEPIRRFCIKNIAVSPDMQNPDSSFYTVGSCPVIGGDTIRMSSGETEGELHILGREGELTADGGFRVRFVCGSGEFASFADKDHVDISRTVTDKTLCEAPFDEMYIEYICAQICFYQRNFDAYREFISRYNARMEEFGKFMKEYESENDRGEFIKWW